MYLSATPAAAAGPAPAPGPISEVLVLVNRPSYGGLRIDSSYLADRPAGIGWGEDTFEIYLRYDTGTPFHGTSLDNQDTFSLNKSA